MPDAKIHLTVNFPFNKSPRNAVEFRGIVRDIRRLLQYHFSVEGFGVLEIQCNFETHYRNKPHVHFVLNRLLGEQDVIDLLSNRFGWTPEDDGYNTIVRIGAIYDLARLANYLSKASQKVFAGKFANVNRSFICLHQRYRPHRPPTVDRIGEIGRSRRDWHA